MFPFRPRKKQCSAPSCSSSFQRIGLSSEKLSGLQTGMISSAAARTVLFRMCIKARNTAQALPLRQKEITVRSMERRNIRQANEKMRGSIPVSVSLNRAAATVGTAEFKAKIWAKHPISVQAGRSIADVCKACVSILRPLPRSVGILHRFVL